MKFPVGFKNSSIRVKLWCLIFLNSSFALLLAGLGLFAFENVQQRVTATREVITQAGIVAESSTAALSFFDERAAAGTLQALRGNPHLLRAAIYDRSNHLLAQYKLQGTKTGSAPERLRLDGVYFENGALLAFEPVRLDGERIGTVFLESSMDEVYARLRRYIGIVCLVLIFSLGVALVPSWRMQKSITRPLGGLSNAAHRVSLEKNYAIRAVKDADDEIGFLIDSFNEMLAQIEVREQARKSAEESLRESEERYALAARGANDGLWDWRLARNEIYFSPRWGQMLGYTDADTWSDPEEWFGRIHPADRDRVLSEIAAHREGKVPEFVSEYRMRHRNGTLIWMLSRGIAVRDASGKAIRMAGSQTDITEGKIADPLTGLPNRLYFLDRLENSIEATRRRAGLFAVLFLDLDRFKLINDSMGHAAGDELLAETGRRLQLSVDDGELAGGNAGPCVIARLGGDEFAVLLNGIREKTDAIRIAERILRNLEAPFWLSGRQVFASVSIGMALSNSGNSPEDLLRNADTAMYHAKNRGKARLEVFDESMRERALARLEIETELRKAIDTWQLVLYFQPQVALHTGRITGFEALVRWEHPQRGLILPGEFIPIAEETDLILPLGRWVLAEACRQMAVWQKQFVMDPPLTISVNVSFRQLMEPGLVDDVKRVLAESGLRPGTLRLEMTESTIMANADDAIDALRRLKEMNVGLEIDDFGTGYSSLSHLNRLPFDTLKIDRSFVRELVSGESSEIVVAILKVAHSLGMSVITEGIETAEQLRLLTELGCNYGQGYYFARPLALEAAQALIESRESVSAALVPAGAFAESVELEAVPVGV